MIMRSARHILMVVAAPLLAIMISVFALGGTASAHVVTSITADCYLVTAHFSDFPDTGVLVHIAADVNGQTVSSDVLVTNTTSEAHLDISAATAVLVDTPAHIDVDVTWTYLGPQHVHKTLTATCGTPTTTTSNTTPTQAIATTTTPAPPTTTTPATTTPTVPQPTTSTQVLGTTIIATTTAPPTTTKGTVGVQGATVASTTTVPAVAALPRTGSNPGFPLMFGLSSLVAGALLLLRQRRTSGRTNEDWRSAT
jgi:LPXTG-motif cell wall-anchored protein